MKIESYGYKFLIADVGSRIIKGKTLVATSHKEAFQYFCDILESGFAVWICLYRHDKFLGGTSLSVDEYTDLGSEDAWLYAMKHCEASNDDK
jgi:transposase